MVDFIKRYLSVSYVVFLLISRAALRRSCRAASRLLRRCAAVAQALEGRLDHVNRVVGAVALGADVLHAAQLEHSTRRAAGDNAGTFRQPAAARSRPCRNGRRSRAGCWCPSCGRERGASWRPRSPLRAASGISVALPIPQPTRPLPSPMTTRAAKRKLRPPLTTLVTRLMETIFSWNSLSGRRSRRGPRSRRSPRSCGFFSIS